MRPLVASLYFFLNLFFFKKDYQLETATLNPCYISLLVFVVKKKVTEACPAVRLQAYLGWTFACFFNYTKSWCFNRRELLDPIATINGQYSVTKQCLLEYKIHGFS